MEIIVSLLPVLLFLLFLVYLDTFKLVRTGILLLSIYWGIISAALSFYANGFLIDLSGLGLGEYSRYVSPLVEELIKASYFILLFRFNKVAFLIDAAIHGFAIGAGFAIMENSFYLFSLTDSHFFIWIMRGFGTAVMHGGATAILGIFIAGALNKKGYGLYLNILAGLLTAYILHSVYNHFVIDPLTSAILISFAVPLVMILVFTRNESGLRDWLEVEFDTEASLLQMMRAGEFSGTRAGEYIISIKSRFDPEVVFDMIVYIKLHLELSIRAKGILLMRESGLKPEYDKSVEDKLKEMDYLRKSIGRTGLLALSPILITGKKELWKQNLLRET